MAEPRLLERVRRKAPQNSKNDLEDVFTLVKPNYS
jgi:hypothetical protein